jgi:hypothetical protein
MSGGGHDGRVKDIGRRVLAPAEASKTQSHDISNDKAISLDIYKR